MPARPITYFLSIILAVLLILYLLDVHMGEPDKRGHSRFDLPAFWSYCNQRYDYPKV